MAKVLNCGDLMPGCKAVLEGKDEAEVMAKGAAHAKQAHNIATIPPEMAAKVKAADQGQVAAGGASRTPEAPTDCRPAVSRWLWRGG
jgi:predicted small metal-binding protein